MLNPFLREQNKSSYPQYNSPSKQALWNLKTVEIGGMPKVLNYR
jgi:hypothetical protein